MYDCRRAAVIEGYHCNISVNAVLESHWAEIAGFIADLARCASVDEATAQFVQFLLPFGVDTFSCGRVHLQDRSLAVFYALNWPDSWRECYLRSGLVNRDPLFEKLTTYRQAFTWGEMRQDRLLPSFGGDALRILAEHGWIDGLAVPVACGADCIGLVSLASRGMKLKPSDKTVLTVACVQFYDRARRLAATRGFPVPPVGLSRREIECLRLVATGKSDRAIGQILKVSAATAHEHLENAKAKLHAGARAEAVAKAVALGIVDP